MARKKITLYTLDRKSGRWRKNGKFASPPKKSELSKDKAGNIVDATGKRVASAILATLPKPTKKPAKKPTKKPAKKSKPAKKLPKAPPKRPKPRAKPKSKPKPRPKAPPTRVFRPRKRRKLPLNVEFVPHGAPITKKPLLSSSFQNARSPEKAYEVLERFIRRKSYNKEVKFDDVVLFSAGVNFVNEGPNPGRLGSMAKFATEIGELYPDLRVKFSADSMQILVGDGETPMLVGPHRRDSTRVTASVLLERAGPVLEDIWGILQDLWDTENVGWVVMAENEELEGGS